ncbi:MAG: type III-A CRISPR-associated RAMP protein Csm3 [Clostridiales bacterium]|jgi:CRISPR-associated protein Csm3|nr:type III-A CRISPR-associated RAMP protein Csm3 [Clostridiales bacterium]
MGFSKFLISGEIEVVTGLHIGGTDSYSAIGAVDSPVIRDSVTGNPIIPGSSIKGKMRSLLQKTFGASPSHNEDHDQVLRLFGSSSDKNKEAIPSRLKFNDCFMNEESEKALKNANIRLTEVKTENSIDRKTSKANPRQIERVVRGSIFDFELFYDVLNEDELEEDFKNISTAIKLLESDYLGGHGSRGSGRIKFNNLKVTRIFGDAPTIELEV